MRKHILVNAAAVMLVTSLAACGGDGSTSDNIVSNQGQGQGQGQEQGQGQGLGNADSFLTFVASLAGSSSETAEPQAIGDVMTTTPDNVNPAPVS